VSFSVGIRTLFYLAQLASASGARREGASGHVPVGALGSWGKKGLSHGRGSWKAPLRQRERIFAC